MGVEEEVALLARDIKMLLAEQRTFAALAAILNARTHEGATPLVIACRSHGFDSLISNRQRVGNGE